jgi:hypothetical protein
VKLPPSCEIVNVRWSGLRSLDLRGVSACIVNISMCGQLEKMTLPQDFGGILFGCSNVRLSHVTMMDMLKVDDGGWLDWVRPRHVRFMSQHCRGLGKAVVSFSPAFALGEVGCVGGRQTRPSLP